MDITEIVQKLKAPGIFPDCSHEVRVEETHISYLFFTGSLVYKIKKSVDFGFLDFTTLEKRGHFCREEVRLNARLSPNIYLGVAEITETDGGISLGGNGRVVEYAVVMRQLPEEGMLRNLLNGEKVDASLMDAIAKKVAAFHSNAERNETIDGYGDVSAIKRNANENFIQSVPFINRTITGEQHEFISGKTLDFIERNKKIFAQRKLDGWIRDCHGDLHIGSICVENGKIEVIDCIEFNERFRCSDTAADVAFLAMDLEYNGYHAFSDAFLSSYLKYSKDTDLPLVLRFYKAYRAYVRGKVASFLLDEKEVSDEMKKKALDDARRYFGLGYSYFMQPTMIIMAGLMGSGKSTVGELLGRSIGASVARSDVIRKGLAGMQPEDRALEEYKQGIYTDDFSMKTYAELHRIAGETLKNGRNIILDASHKDRLDRAAAMEVARGAGARYFIVECVCDDTTAYERLTARTDEKEASDGRWELYEQQKQDYQYVTENEGRLIRIDTTRPVQENIMLIMRIIGR